MSRDWIEDFNHENGMYGNLCIECENEFIGHKRRMVCRICAAQQRVQLTALRVCLLGAIPLIVALIAMALFSGN